MIVQLAPLGAQQCRPGIVHRDDTGTARTHRGGTLNQKHCRRLRVDLSVIFSFYVCLFLFFVFFTRVCCRRTLSKHSTGHHTGLGTTTWCRHKPTLSRRVPALHAVSNTGAPPLSSVHLAFIGSSTRVGDKPRPPFHAALLQVQDGGRRLVRRGEATPHPPSRLQIMFSGLVQKCI